MGSFEDISSIRRQYGQSELDENTLDACPFKVFEQWLSDALKVDSHTDPTAMVLSTVDEFNCPDSRVVLLKEMIDNQFVFYTHYQSSKAKQMEAHPQVALNFHWPSLARQVRIRGVVSRTSTKHSDAYFSSRPVSSQISAIVSPQSSLVTSRDALQTACDAMKQLPNRAIIRPDYWGGYQVLAKQIEFWQGRDDRLHDRIQYSRNTSQTWCIARLAP